MKSGLNNVAISQNNRGLILRLALTTPMATRTTISASSGLTKMTACNIVSDYIKQGILVEQETPDSSAKPGRPALSLALSPAAPKYICLTIRDTSVSVYLSDLLGHPVKGLSIDNSSLDKDAYVAKTYEAIDEILRASISERINGISIANFQPVASSPKSIIYTHDEKVETIDIVSLLEERYKIPVSAIEGNQADAIYEFYYGVAKGVKNFIYINLADEIGCGIYQNGEIMQTNLVAGIRLGHLSIDYNGLSCSCGNRGCLQSYVSPLAMEKKLRDITKLKTDFKGFCDMQTKKNDSRIDWAFKDMMDKMGFALISISNILAPELIVFGGDGVNIPDRYLAKLEKTLSSKAYEKAKDVKIIKTQSLDNNVAVGIAPILLNLFN